MRTMVDPPPMSRCPHCGGQLKLKSVDMTYANVGLKQTIYACGNCGQEPAFAERQDRQATIFGRGNKSLRH